MKNSSSIVRVDKRPYRVIARENWGLTEKQMEGMHVHHRIPLSQGGTNDPSNLYVCSPYFHAYVWHEESHYTKNALKGARAAVQAKKLLRDGDPGWRKRELQICREAALALHEKRKSDEDLDRKFKDYSARGGRTSMVLLQNRIKDDEIFKNF
jgi:hypothetical protein